MSSGHLQVHLGNGTVEGVVSVLLVHVDSTSSGQVSQENSVVSDASSLLLEDFTSGDDLTLDLSNLVLTLHVVPELGTSQDGITFENTHSVKCWVSVLLSGQGTAHDIELSNLYTKN